MTKCLFFVFESRNNIVPHIPDATQYIYKLWKPSITRLVPPGCSAMPFIVWSMFHWLRIFANCEYSVLLIYDGEQAIHRSCVFPKYFRFPFMDKEDLQIGDTWTDTKYRRKGLASNAISYIIGNYSKDNRKFWYLTEEGNISSVKVVEKVGFIKFGEGTRTKRFGISLLGTFAIAKCLVGEKA